MINSSTIVSKPKVAAASRRGVLASSFHSPAIVSPTPSHASQAHNVRKCPVLSGPANLPEQHDASHYKQTACAQNPSHPDRTLTGYHPAQPLNPNPPNRPILFQRIPRQFLLAAAGGEGNRSVFARNKRYTLTESPALSPQPVQRNLITMSALRIGIIGGTGLGQELATNHNDIGRRHDVDTPFGKPSDAIIETQIAGLTVLILNRHGPGHLLNPSAVPSRANIFALKSLGCTHIIASGAVGSLREELRPRDVVVVDQFIDKTAARPGTFFDHAAVHTEFAEPCCPILRKLLIDAAENITARAEHDFKVHSRGCYVCMEGPAFSTRAESLMHRLWGGDLIGMTALPEARLAREAEIPYALLALVTDYDCWHNKPADAPADSAELLKEIIANLQVAMHNTITLIQAALAMAKDHQTQLMAAPAREALKLAIWSDKSQIAKDEVRRLAPLWGKYFPA